MYSVYNDVMRNLFEFEGKHLHLKIHSVVCGTHAMTFVKQKLLKVTLGTMAVTNVFTLVHGWAK